MAWTAYVQTDADKDDVGSARAVWNEGQADEFSYSRRVKICVAEADAFKAEAVEALAAHNARVAADSAYSDYLSGVMNNG